jgi:hypothetical protein
MRWDGAIQSRRRRAIVSEAPAAHAKLPPPPRCTVPPSDHDAFDFVEREGVRSQSFVVSARRAR